jgi:hypothetical protein
LLPGKWRLPAAGGVESSICKEENIPIRSLIPVQAPGNAAAVGLKLPAASGVESSIFKEENNYIRSLTPGQAPGNALAERFKFFFRGSRMIRRITLPERSTDMRFESGKVSNVHSQKNIEHQTSGSGAEKTLPSHPSASSRDDSGSERIPGSSP